MAGHFWNANARADHLERVAGHPRRRRRPRHATWASKRSGCANCGSCCARRRKHKFRFNYLPIKYEAEAPVTREFVFNGQRYRVGLPVNTTADLTTLRFGYEYDFFYHGSRLCGRAPRPEIHERRRRAQQPDRRSSS